MFKKAEKIKLPEMEKKILSFWKGGKIFEKSVNERPLENSFTFYDGPPYATGMPHYGNLLAGIIKDVIPRYKTMRGYRVERVWGWDTHGLPIENIVEKKLGFKTRDEIKAYGIDNFNEACRLQVLEYAEAWKNVIDRTGRWVDMESAYTTMDKNYMESIWWVFIELYKKDLIYEWHKVMPYCPRCATGQSSFEVGLGGYQERIDQAVTVKFEFVGEPKTFFLAWTTTPWTLPGNLALTVGEKIDYVLVESDGCRYFLAESRLEGYSKELKNYQIIQKLKGKDLIGKRYKPIFDYYQKSQEKDSKDEVFVVISGDFVTTDEGTGIVHTAPAFGEDDQAVAKKFGIGFFMPVDDLGNFTEETDYHGLNVTDSKTNQKIIEDLGAKAFKIEDYKHPYPHCWRCQSPLIFKAIDSWFLAIDKIREKISRNNETVFWMPEFIGKNRYAKMIQNAPDWNISRNRFWGVPIPVWKCECGKKLVFGSISELEKASNKKIDDIHLHKISGIQIDCCCGKKANITGEILDVWFDSGSMPYGRLHYPFENKEKFEREFPADFIAEGIDQTRGWFNSLLVLGTALFGKSPFKSVIVNGTVLAENGQKMSKSLKNFPDALALIERYGADALRFYLMGSPAVRAEDLKFSEKGVEEVVRKTNLTLLNSYSFFLMYASLDNFSPCGNLKTNNLLDRWLVSRTNRLIDEVTVALDGYDISLAVKKLTIYIDELSNWYIRRSRKRFWKSEDDLDKKMAYETLYFSLVTYAKLISPFMPFIGEEIYQGLVVAINKNAPESVHLSDWPKKFDNVQDSSLEKQMSETRKIVEAGLSARNEAGIRVRQSLSELEVNSSLKKLSSELESIVLEEVNVKKITFKSSKDFSVSLNTKITKELKAEGIARDFIRFVQEGRKKAGLNVEDRIITTWNSNDVETRKAISSQAKHISKETLSVNFREEGKIKDGYSEDVRIENKSISFSIKKAESS